MSDYDNEITIEGNSSDQVQSVATSIQNQFAQHDVIGGSGERRNIGMSFFLIILVLACFALYHDKNKLATSLFVASMMPMVLSFLSFHVLPGTAIYLGDPSFWSRNGAYVGALSLLVGIICLHPVLVAGYARIKKDSTKSENLG